MPIKNMCQRHHTIAYFSVFAWILKCKESMKNVDDAN
jgi:hypothetical protein